MEYTLLQRGKPYPSQIPLKQRATAEFLKTGGSTLLITMPGILDAEEKEIRKNPVKAGIIVDGPLILWVFKFGKQTIFDAPFDARKYKREELVLHDIENADQRLGINLTLVDSHTRIVKGLRHFTLSPGITLDFFSAVQQQLSDHRRTEPYLTRYLHMPLNQMLKMAKLQPCGR